MQNLSGAAFGAAFGKLDLLQYINQQHIFHGYQLNQSN